MRRHNVIPAKAGIQTLLPAPRRTRKSGFHEFTGMTGFATPPHLRARTASTDDIFAITNAKFGVEEVQVVVDARHVALVRQSTITRAAL